MNASYYTQNQAEDAMSVVAGWIGQNRKVRVVYHSGSAVCADIEQGIIRIPRMACASGVTQEALMLLRHSVYHEAGHISETNIPKPEGALGEIVNALEDRRMESAIGAKHKGCASVFRQGTEWYNKDIARKALENGGIQAPLWEALVAMAFQVEGILPAWNLSKKAQAYVDAAYDEFAKVKLCKSAKDCVELAKRILALLKDANEQYKKENPQPQQEQQQNQSQKQQGGEQDGEPQQSGQGDLDDDEGSEGDSEGSESKSGDDSESDDEGSESGSGSESGDDEGDEGDEGQSGGKGDEDGDEDSESESGDSESGEGDEDGDQSGSGSGSDCDADEGDDEGEFEVSGKGDSDQQDGDKADQQDGGEKQDGPDGDTPYEADNERQQDKGNNGDLDDDGEPDEWKDTDLDDEIDGQSREDAMNEAIADLLDDLDPQDASYLSRRDLDEHNVPNTRDSDKTAFKQQHEEIAVMTASMTRALEQALRSICRSKREGYKRQGRIDRKRLTAIAKGLSKEVFFQIRDGQNLECAVEIIIDESGSMGNYRAVRLLAIAIGEALNAIGVPFEITGTTTKYGMGAYGIPDLDGMSRTNPIKYNHYVLFGEKWQSVRHRLVHTGAHMHNIDGEAVEYCAFRLAQRSERRKIVFSLSDGEPCGGQGTDTQLARNLIRVCQKARKNGIEVYGFGVGTEAPQAYYGKEHFVYLDDPTTMDQVFIRKFADVVTGGRVRV